MRFELKAAGFAAVVMAVTPVMAEEAVGRGVNPQAAVNLNFQVDMRDFIRFRVGAEAAINTLVFDLNTRLDAGGIGGDGTAFEGLGGDVAGSTVTVQLISNVGAVNIAETNNSPGGLSNGATAGALFIPFTEIETASSNPALPPPTLSNAGGTTVAVAPSGTANDDANFGSGDNHTGATNRLAQWTYRFLNNGIYEPGSYTAIVTYTASAAP